MEKALLEVTEHKKQVIRNFLNYTNQGGLSAGYLTKHLLIILKLKQSLWQDHAI